MIGAVVGEIQAVGEFEAGDGVVRLKEVGAVGYFDGLVVGRGFVGQVDGCVLVGVVECAVSDVC